MRNKRFWSIWLGLLAGLSLVLAACGPSLTETVSPINTPPAASQPKETGKLQESLDVTAEAQEIVDLVRQDLSEQLAIPADEIRVVDIEAVEWPDSSMGCPQPGMSYLQVITPGYKIVLEVNGEEYTYHTGTSAFILCKTETAMDEPKSADPQPDKSPLDAKTAALVEEAKKDLMERAGVDMKDITVLAATKVEWPDSSLGCPKPGMNYLMVVTPGVLIKLSAEGESYEYHGDTESVFYCEDPKPPLSSNPVAQGRVVKQAMSDLAQRLGIATTEIEVVEVEEIQWNDASLGCPEPDMMYAQVLTPGYRIILSAQGQEYDYRANLKAARLCEQVEP